MVGQPYRIGVMMEVPDSTVNQVSPRLIHHYIMNMVNSFQGAGHVHVLSEGVGQQQQGH